MLDTLQYKLIHDCKLGRERLYLYQLLLIKGAAYFKASCQKKAWACEGEQRAIDAWLS